MARVRGRSAVTEVSETGRWAEFSRATSLHASERKNVRNSTSGRLFTADGEQNVVISYARPALKSDQAFSLLGARNGIFFR